MRKYCYFSILLLFSALLGIVEFYVGLSFRNIGIKYHYSICSIPLSFVASCFVYKYVKEWNKFWSIAIWISSMLISVLAMEVMIHIYSIGNFEYFYYSISYPFLLGSFVQILLGWKYHYDFYFMIAGLVDLVIYGVSILICAKFGNNKCKMKPY